MQSARLFQSVLKHAGASKKAINFNVARCMSTSGLKEILESKIPEHQARFKKIKQDHGSKVVDQVTVNQIIGGARGIKSMIWETSNLDANEGIRFRGKTIPECQAELPGAFEGGEPTPESLMWLLMTGDVPTKAQSDALTAELHARSTLPDHIEPMIRNFPKGMHPMTQFTIAVNAMQTDSEFAKAYASGIHKTKYWEPTYEDILNLVARLPEVAALIYRCSFKDGVIKKDLSLDYSANFCRMLGYDNESIDELMRLYLTIHSDHEGGNASAHTTHLVGSTLADPYLSYAAGLNSLAGPLHGLANQEVLKWTLDLQKHFNEKGLEVTKENITQFAWDTLNSGKVIPGFGHAVLRQTDPRYMCQREFGFKHLPEDDELFKIIRTIFDVMPGVLTEHGKTKNPFPNVDAHSGVLLWHYNIREFEYYTVLFGVSRAIGALSQMFWDRALGFPLERPKSVTPEWIEETCSKM
mmetsp:Transcript_29022/g.38140  ORF Transcript_29022/g.38140 Transcript_29022/m.38140 type:complete len:468 (-) Transcript_29022:429-1832(-)|eukprot:CAMPEP_0117760386 /NCGR_PEP_ID=MMETSP0947-20121206/16597_1 /TAXON_ID=44440 /ORGANISM="Chattonella subsalsa, Strain CCMP2191" /LENGTH=467 /DNA_ID=CAMNT_0005581063 /DNA_START=52 /DNA_END=1455 /DNA_ORIENTATION=+